MQNPVRISFYPVRHSLLHAAHAACELNDEIKELTIASNFEPMNDAHSVFYFFLFSE